MALIAVTADKGSPGVTTTAVALAAIWPRPVLLAECDPSGGDVVYRLPGQDGQRLDPRRGLLSLAVAARRGPQSHQVWPHVQKLRGGLDVLAGVTSAEQGAGLDGLWGSVGAALAALPEADVIADCGRLGPGGRFYDLLAHASAVVMVSKATLGDVVRLRERTAAVAAAVRDRGGPGTGIGVIVVADHKHFSAAIAEVSQALGTGGPAGVVGGLAWEPKSADLLRGEWGGKLDKSLLIRTARQIAGQLAAQLPAPASAAGPGAAGPRPPQPAPPAYTAAPLAHPGPSAHAGLGAHAGSAHAGPGAPAEPLAHLATAAPAAPEAHLAAPPPLAEPRPFAAPRQPVPAPAPAPVPADAGDPAGRPLVTPLDAPWAVAHGPGGGPRASHPPADRLVASSRSEVPQAVPTQAVPTQAAPAQAGGLPAPGYPGHAYPVTGPVTGHYAPAGPGPQPGAAAHSDGIPAGPGPSSGSGIAAHSGPGYPGFAPPSNGETANHSDGNHTATNSRPSARLAGNSAGRQAGNPAGPHSGAGHPPGPRTGPAGYPGDPYAVTVPPGSGHPMAGYADAGWADVPASAPPASALPAPGPHAPGPNPPGPHAPGPPHQEERLRELPRGRHSGARPASPPDREAG